MIHYTVELRELSEHQLNLTRIYILHDKNKMRLKSDDNVKKIVSLIVLNSVSCTVIILAIYMHNLFVVISPNGM